MRTALIVCVLFLGITSQLLAQELQSTGLQDTVVLAEDEIKPHSPKKATILSACLPGAGQIYNKKYWKLPLVYGGIGVSIYLGVRYGDEYRKYRDEYRLLPDGDPTEPGIRNLRDTYRRWMELSYISVGIIYVLQIVDANVDAHLMEFDVSDDLSMRVEPKTLPVYNQPHQAVGLGVSFNFK